MNVHVGFRNCDFTFVSILHSFQIGSSCFCRTYCLEMYQDEAPSAWPSVFQTDYQPLIYLGWSLRQVTLYCSYSSGHSAIVSRHSVSLFERPFRRTPKRSARVRGMLWASAFIYLKKAQHFFGPDRCKGKYSSGDFELQNEDYGSDIKLSTPSEEIVLKKQQH